MRDLAARRADGLLAAASTRRRGPAADRLARHVAERARRKPELGVRRVDPEPGGDHEAGARGEPRGDEQAAGRTAHDAGPVGGRRAHRPAEGLLQAGPPQPEDPPRAQRRTLDRRAGDLGRIGRPELREPNLGSRNSGTHPNAARRIVGPLLRPVPRYSRLAMAGHQGGYIKPPGGSASGPRSLMIGWAVNRPCYRKWSQPRLPFHACPSTSTPRPLRTVPIARQGDGTATTAGNVAARA